MLKKFASDLTRGLRSMVRGVDADWEFDERRRTVRFNCRHKVDLLLSEEEAKDMGYVLEYSMGGLRVSHRCPLKPGQRLKVRFPHPLPGVSVRAVECEVIWRRKNPKTLETLAGMKFVETRERMANSWVAYFFRERDASSKDLVEHRRSYRTTCSLDVVARSEDERSVGKLENISTGGAFLRINRPAEVGDRWGLDISGLSTFEAMHIEGTVQSCDMDESGLYEQRITFDELDEETEKILQKYLLALTKNFWKG